MWEFSAETKPTARKDYHCEASDWIINTVGLDEREFEPEDWAKIEEARKNGFKILKGEKYINVSGKWEGEFSTFRAIPELNDICIKYDLYCD